MIEDWQVGGEPTFFRAAEGAKNDLIYTALGQVLKCQSKSLILII